MYLAERVKRSACIRSDFQQELLTSFLLALWAEYQDLLQRISPTFLKSFGPPRRARTDTRSLEGYYAANYISDGRAVPD